MKLKFEIRKGCYSTLCPAGFWDPDLHIRIMVGTPACENCNFFKGRDRKSFTVNCVFKELVNANR